MSDSFVIPWTVALQAPLAVGFPRQEYWSWLLFPSPEDLPDPGIEPMSPTLAGRFFTTEPPGKPLLFLCTTINCDAGRDWGQEEKGMTEDEMAGWHH